MLSDYVLFFWLYDVLNNLLRFTIIVSGALLGVIVMFYFSDDDSEKKIRYKKYIKISLIVFLIFSVLILILPRENHIYAYLGAKSIDSYNLSNENSNLGLNELVENTDEIIDKAKELLDNLVLNLKVKKN